MLSVLVVIAVIFMIICGCRLIWLILRYQEADNLYADIGEEILLPELPSEDDENPEEENEVKQAVDFQKLLSINEEVVAWISIPALELEYPVTQGEDNEYYLHYAYGNSFSFIIRILNLTWNACCLCFTKTLPDIQNCLGSVCCRQIVYDLMGNTGTSDKLPAYRTVFSPAVCNQQRFPIMVQRHLTG